MKNPNILFIFSDQHRHDVLGCAGHSLVQTPNLDRLADWGMRFERTWTQCPVLLPITRWIGCNRAIPRSPFIFTWVLCSRMFR